MPLKRPLIFTNGLIREIGSEIIPGMWADPALTQNIFLREMLKRRWAAQPGGALLNGAQVDGYTDEDLIDGSSVYAYDGTNKCVTCAATATTQDRLPTGDVSHDAGISPYSYTNVDDPIGTPDDNTTKISWNTYPASGFEYARYSFTAFSVPAGSTITKLRITWRSYVDWPTDNMGETHPTIKVNGTDYYATSGSPTWGTWETRTYDWTTNPNTSAAWTVDDINGSGSHPLQTIGLMGYLNSAGGAGHTYGSQVYATVYYTAPDAQNLSLISTPITGLFTASYAWAMLLVENYDASVLAYVSTATSPSWTSLGALTLLCNVPDADLSGVELYGTGLVPITGSADKANSLKIVADYGNDTKIYGAFLQVME